MIKGYTNCRIFVGQNGRIWLDGEVDNIMHAIKAIQMIEEDAHSFGLTEKVQAYLETVSPQTAPKTE
jgi:exosome complex component RRP4